MLKDLGVNRYYVPCGRCSDCAHRRKQDWLFRMFAESTNSAHKHIVFLNFTFRDEDLPDFKVGDGFVDSETGEVLFEFKDKPIADKYSQACLSSRIRHWKDNVRKWLGYFPKHFLITERGDEEKTNRIHLHGFLFLDGLHDDEKYDKPKFKFIEERGIKRLKCISITPAAIDFFEKLRNTWKYGISWCEEMAYTSAFGYVTKYILKGIEQRIKGDKLCAKIYVSNGFGACAITPERARLWYGDDEHSYNALSDLTGVILAVPRYIMQKVITSFGFRKLAPPDESYLKFLTVEGVNHCSLESAMAHRDGLLRDKTQLGLYNPTPYQRACGKYANRMRYHPFVPLPNPDFAL